MRSAKVGVKSPTPLPVLEIDDFIDIDDDDSEIDEDATISALNGAGQGIIGPSPVRGISIHDIQISEEFLQQSAATSTRTTSAVYKPKLVSTVPTTTAAELSELGVHVNTQITSSDRQGPSLMTRQLQPKTVSIRAHKATSGASLPLPSRWKQEAVSKIIKTGIPPDADSNEVIDSVVKVFSILKRTWPMIDSSSAIGKTNIPMEAFDISRNVITLIGNIVGDWKNFFNADASKRNMVLEKLQSKLNHGDFSPSSQDDLSLFIQYKPMELIGDMLTLIILELMSFDIIEAQAMANRLQKVLQDPSIYKENAFKPMYVFLHESLQLLMKGLTTLEQNVVEDKDVPSDAEWSDEMLRNRFLIWFIIDGHLRMDKKDECQKMATDLVTQNCEDVEWLVTLAGVLREKRLSSMFPRDIDPLEKKLVKLAYSLEPQNPFVVLSLMDILSDQKKKASSEFHLTCRNLLHKCEKSVHIMLKISRYCLKNGRNRDLGFECLTRAINLNSKHPLANYMCGKYMCKAGSKISFSMGYNAKDMFFRVAMLCDSSDFTAVFEYFKTVFGRSRSVGMSSLFASVHDDNERGPSLFNSGTTPTCIADTLIYNDMILDVLNSSYSKAWTPVQRAKLKFLSALSYYIRAEHDEAIDTLLTIYKHNQIISMIQMLDQLCETCDWDKTRLSFDKFHQWLQMEMEYYNADDGEFDGDDTDDFEENEDDVNPDCECPVKEMLAYLFRVL